MNGAWRVRWLGVAGCVPLHVAPNRTPNRRINAEPVHLFDNFLQLILFIRNDDEHKC